MKVMVEAELPLTPGKVEVVSQAYNDQDENV